ncbi:hypothetical protein EYF80_064034 [Liparis tanakae]|uniref:Uncharacterized protein n=1 Tax=Liparis tanakae TaxID=230148 RepID=A0A4Z2EBB5_9TELE|nr:hypothetical protein EYF80_064034 [Liparis tanakae]
MYRRSIRRRARPPAASSGSGIRLEPDRPAAPSCPETCPNWLACSGWCFLF